MVRESWSHDLVGGRVCQGFKSQSCADLLSLYYLKAEEEDRDLILFFFLH